MQYQYIFTKFFTFVFVVMTIFFLGCSQKLVMSQKDLFLAQRSDIASKYLELNITSFGAYREHLTQEYSEVTTIFRILKKIYQKNSAVIKDIENLATIYQDDFRNRQNYIGSITENDLMVGDEIYYFKYVDKGKIEYGVLILNNGNIKERYVSEIRNQ